MKLSVVDDRVVQEPKTGRYKVGNDHINLKTSCLPSNFYAGKKVSESRKADYDYLKQGLSKKSGILSLKTHCVVTACNEQSSNANSCTKPQKPVQRPESPVHFIQ